MQNELWLLRTAISFVPIEEEGYSVDQGDQGRERRCRPATPECWDRHRGENQGNLT